MKSIFLRTIPQSICRCSSQQPPPTAYLDQIPRVWPVAVAGCCTGAGSTISISQQQQFDKENQFSGSL